MLSSRRPASGTTYPALAGEEGRPPSHQLPFDGKERVFFNLLLQLRFQMADDVVALSVDFILPRKEFSSQLAALDAEEDSEDGAGPLRMGPR